LKSQTHTPSLQPYKVHTAAIDQEYPEC